MLDLRNGGDALKDAAAVAKVRMAYKKIGDDIADTVLDAVGDADTAIALAMRVETVSRAVDQLNDGVDHLPQIVAEALADPRAKTPRDFEKVALAKVQETLMAQRGDDGRVGMGPTVGRDFTGGADRRAKMIAGIEALIDPRNASPMGRDAAQAGFGWILMQMARDAGHRVFTPTEASGALMSADTTSDYPQIISGAVGNVVARRIAQAMPALARLSREISRDDYRPARSLTLSATSMPQEVNEGGEITFTTADEKGEFLPVPRDFASGYNFTNRAMVNDSTALNLLAQIGDRMVQGAIERWRAVLLEPLLANSGAGQNMSDGNALFRTQRGNLAATGGALSITTLDAARVAMRRQTGLRGELLAIDPKFLLVPPELETVAQQIVAPIQAVEASKANPFADMLEVVVEPGLTSTSAWYLVADPTIYDGLTHCFLDGQSSPKIESRPAWETLGMQFRMSWALDAKFVEPATWYRNAGV